MSDAPIAATPATDESRMAMWRRVCQPDTKFLKPFNRSGGFSGTAINATYLAMLATREWGTCGVGWGLNIVSENYREGHTLSKGDKCIVHIVLAELWYIDPASKVRGSVHQYGQTTFVGENKNGAYTDEEAPKKSITDAMSKCLSLCGFAADIHMGAWDGNKYIEDRSQATAHDAASAPQRPAPAASRAAPPAPRQPQATAPAGAGSAAPPAAKVSLVELWAKHGITKPRLLAYCGLPDDGKPTAAMVAHLNTALVAVDAGAPAADTLEAMYDKHYKPAAEVKP